MASEHDSWMLADYRLAESTLKVTEKWMVDHTSKSCKTMVTCRCQNLKSPNSEKKTRVLHQGGSANSDGSHHCPSA